MHSLVLAALVIRCGLWTRLLLLQPGYRLFSLQWPTNWSKHACVVLAIRDRMVERWEYCSFTSYFMDFEKSTAQSEFNMKPSFDTYVAVNSLVDSYGVAWLLWGHQQVLKLISWLWLQLSWKYSSRPSLCTLKPVNILQETFETKCCYLVFKMLSCCSFIDLFNEKTVLNRDEVGSLL